MCQCDAICPGQSCRSWPNPWTFLWSRYRSRLPSTVTPWRLCVLNCAINIFPKAPAKWSTNFILHHTQATSTSNLNNAQSRSLGLVERVGASTSTQQHYLAIDDLSKLSHLDTGSIYLMLESQEVPEDEQRCFGNKCVKILKSLHDARDSEKPLSPFGPIFFLLCGRF
jgi:hypothetical protein